MGLGGIRSFLDEGSKDPSCSMAFISGMGYMVGFAFVNLFTADGVHSCTNLAHVEGSVYDKIELYSRGDPGGAGPCSQLLRIIESPVWSTPRCYHSFLWSNLWFIVHLFHSVSASPFHKHLTSLARYADS